MRGLSSLIIGSLFAVSAVVAVAYETTLKNPAYTINGPGDITVHVRICWNPAAQPAETAPSPANTTCSGYEFDEWLPDEPFGPEPGTVTGGPYPYPTPDPAHVGWQCVDMDFHFTGMPLDNTGAEDYVLTIKLPDGSTASGGTCSDDTESGPYPRSHN